MTDPFDLTGKVAVVTGSSRGIGRAIAERLAQRGARVVISSRKQDACEEVAGSINSAFGSGRAVAIAASISSKDALEELAQRTRAELGPIDILVCNAASNPHYGSLDTIDDAMFKNTLGIESTQKLVL
ncbi:MAG: SDR family NAD(P)-dependent oxidoreductase [Cypionkella sp.]